MDGNWCRQITEYCARMCGQIGNKRPLIEWMTATGIAIYISTFEKSSGCKLLFQRNTVP